MPVSCKEIAGIAGIAACVRADTEIYVAREALFLLRLFGIMWITVRPFLLGRHQCPNVPIQLLLTPFMPCGLMISIGTLVPVTISIADSWSCFFLLEDNNVGVSISSVVAVSYGFGVSASGLASSSSSSKKPTFAVALMLSAREPGYSVRQREVGCTKSMMGVAALNGPGLKGGDRMFFRSARC